MYSHNSFEIDGSFTLLRPMFIILVIIVLILFFMILYTRTRRKFINQFTVVGLSAVSLIISVQLMYYEGIIVDELGLGGDVVTTYMFLVIAAVSAINPILYFILKSKDT